MDLLKYKDSFKIFLVIYFGTISLFFPLKYRQGRKVTNSTEINWTELSYPILSYPIISYLN